MMCGLKALQGRFHPTTGVKENLGIPTYFGCNCDCFACLMDFPVQDTYVSEIRFGREGASNWRGYDGQKKYHLGRLAGQPVTILVGSFPAPVKPDSSEFPPSRSQNTSP